MDTPMAARPPQGQGQGPQRSPTVGPVNGTDPRAFGPSASGPPAGPRGPMSREGNGGGMPRPGPGRQDGHGQTRPPGMGDGAQGTVCDRGFGGWWDSGVMLPLVRRRFAVHGCERVS